MANKYNVHFVIGAMGMHNESIEDRETNDFYATSPVAVEKLMEIESLNHNIWEPACGLGHIAKPLIEAGYNVICTDLVERGFGKGGIDFLKSDMPFDGDIITNPPYKYAQDFVEHGLQLIPNGCKVCMLLRVSFLEGKTRRKFFEKYPPKTVWVSASRIKFGRNGDFSRSNSMMAIAWYVWEKGYTGDTTLKWFN